MGVNIWGKRRQKQARGVGLQGPRGTWGAGRGWKDSERRDGRWRLEGVDACPGGKAIQDQKRRGRIRYKKSGVCRSIAFQWGGLGMRRVTGKDPVKI